MQIHIDSFTSRVAELPRGKRNAEDVLAVLRQCPLVSCFDLSDYAWLRAAIRDLERAGAIVDDGKEPYPWIRYRVTPNAKVTRADGAEEER